MILVLRQWRGVQVSFGWGGLRWRQPSSPMDLCICPCGCSGLPLFDCMFQQILSLVVSSCRCWKRERESERAMLQTIAVRVLTRRSRGILFLSSFNFEHPRPCGQRGCISNESVCRRETMNMLDCRCAISKSV